MMTDAGPRSISQAMDTKELEEYKAAILSKLASFEANSTFKFISPAKTVKTLIYMRIILQKKHNEKA